METARGPTPSRRNMVPQRLRSIIGLIASATRAFVKKSKSLSSRVQELVSNMWAFGSRKLRAFWKWLRQEGTQPAPRPTAKQFLTFMIVGCLLVGMTYAVGATFAIVNAWQRAVIGTVLQSLAGLALVLDQIVKNVSPDFRNSWLRLFERGSARPLLILLVAFPLPVFVWLWLGEARQMTPWVITGVFVGLLVCYYVYLFSLTRTMDLVNKRLSGTDEQRKVRSLAWSNGIMLAVSAAVVLTTGFFVNVNSYQATTTRVFVFLWQFVTVFVFVPVGALSFAFFVVFGLSGAFGSLLALIRQHRIAFWLIVFGAWSWGSLLVLFGVWAARP